MAEALRKEGATHNESFLARNWQKILAAAIWVTLVGSFVAYSVITGNSPLDTIREIVGLLQTPFGPLLYIVIYTLRPLAFFSAIVLTLLGGAIWGPVFGVLYVVIGANLSATLAFFFGRFLGKGLIKEENDESDGSDEDTGSAIQKYAHRLRKNAFTTVLIMRLVYIPYDLVNYLAGFLRVDYKAFILATIFGSLPGTLTFVLGGASININDALMGKADVSLLNPWAVGASLVLFAASLVLSRYFKQREAAKGAASGTVSA